MKHKERCDQCGQFVPDGQLYVDGYDETKSICNKCNEKNRCKHEWREVYYGTECKHCNLFYPSGSEPWLPID